MSDEDNVINVEIKYENQAEINLSNKNIKFPKNKINITIKKGDNINNNTFKDLAGDIQITEIKFEINYSTLENLDEENKNGNIHSKIVKIIQILQYTKITQENVTEIEVDYRKTQLKYVNGNRFITDGYTYEYKFIFPDTVEVFEKDFFIGINKLNLNIPKNVKVLNKDLFLHTSELNITNINIEENKLELPKLVYCAENLFSREKKKFYLEIKEIKEIKEKKYNETINIECNSGYLHMNEDFFNIKFKSFDKIYTSSLEKFYIKKKSYINEEIIIPLKFTELIHDNRSKYSSEFIHFNKLTAKGLTKIEKTNPINLFTNLEKLCLPNVTTIEGDCFTNLNNLTHVELPRLESDIFLTSMYNLLNLKLGIIEIKKDSPIKKLTNLTHLYLPSFTAINDKKEFKNLKKLTHLELPRLKSDIFLTSMYNLLNLKLGIIEIKKDSPIKKLTNLTYLYLPSVHTIKDIKFFKKLKKLTHLELPRLESDEFLKYIHKQGENLVNLKLGLTEIKKDSPINSFTNLTHLCLPNVNTISDDCFTVLNNLTHLELPRLESIGENCFNGDKKLEYLDLSGITKTKALQLLGEEPLKSIKPDETNIKFKDRHCVKLDKNNNTIFIMNFDCGVPIRKDEEYFDPNERLKTTITTIKIGKEVIKINDNLFKGFVNLEEIDFTQAKNLETIGKGAFQGCANLTELDLTSAKKLKTIDESAFLGCSFDPGKISLPSHINNTQYVTNIKEGITIYITNNNDNNDNNGNIDLGGGYRKPKLRSKKNNKKRRKNKTNKKARGGYKKLSKNTRKMNKYGKMKIKKKFSKIKK